MAKDEARISPRGRRGRSSLIQVMTSPGFKTGVGTGVLVGRALAAGEGERPGEGPGPRTLGPGLAIGAVGAESRVKDFSLDRGPGECGHGHKSPVRPALGGHPDTAATAQPGSLIPVELTQI